MNYAPKRVALLGLGPSLSHYLEVTKRHGGRRALFDEVWAVNALGDILAADRVFLMDDVRVQEAFARLNPSHLVGEMLRWLKGHPGPVYTSRAYPDYPGLVDFPLAEVVRSTGVAYFNNTPAYAIAYAIHIGVEVLSLYGMDYTFANAHVAEKGRACVEFWLGMAKARGMRIVTPASTSLLDSCVPPQERFYGYRTQDVKVDQAGSQIVGVRLEERPMPTDDEIAQHELREDRALHPNPLVARAAAALDYEHARA